MGLYEIVLAFLPPTIMILSGLIARKGLYKDLCLFTGFGGWVFVGWTLFLVEFT